MRLLSWWFGLPSRWDLLCSLYILTCYRYGSVHSLAALVPAPYSEYFTFWGFLRCSARVLKFPSQRFLFYCRLPGCPLKGQFMIHMKESSSASIEVNMGNSESLMSPINGSIMNSPVVQLPVGRFFVNWLSCALRKLRFVDTYSFQSQRWDSIIYWCMNCFRTQSLMNARFLTCQNNEGQVAEVKPVDARRCFWWPSPPSGHSRCQLLFLDVCWIRCRSSGLGWWQLLLFVSAVPWWLEGHGWRQLLLLWCLLSMRWMHSGHWCQFLFSDVCSRCTLGIDAQAADVYFCSSDVCLRCTLGIGKQLMSTSLRRCVLATMQDDTAPNATHCIRPPTPRCRCGFGDASGNLLWLILGSEGCGWVIASLWWWCVELGLIELQD